MGKTRRVTVPRRFPLNGSRHREGHAESGRRQRQPEHRDLAQVLLKLFLQNGVLIATPFKCPIMAASQALLVLAVVGCSRAVSPR